MVDVKLNERKNKIITKLEKKKEILMQERRKLINLLLEIPKQEKFLEFKQESINDLKSQQDKGKITQEGNDGRILTKERLKTVIAAEEHNLLGAKAHLNFMKEDLHYLVVGHNYNEIKTQIINHFKYVDEEVKKFREVFKDVI